MSKLVYRTWWTSEQLPARPLSLLLGLLSIVIVIIIIIGPQVQMNESVEGLPHCVVLLDVDDVYEFCSDNL